MLNRRGATSCPVLAVARLGGLRSLFSGHGETNENDLRVPTVYVLLFDTTCCCRFSVCICRICFFFFLRSLQGVRVLLFARWCVLLLEYKIDSLARHRW